MSFEEFNPCAGCSSHYISQNTGSNGCFNGVAWIGADPTQRPPCHSPSDDNELAIFDDSTLFHVKATSSIDMTVREMPGGIIHLMNCTTGRDGTSSESQPVIIQLANIPEFLEMLLAIISNEDMGAHALNSDPSVLKEIEQTVFDQAELINEEENVTSDRELITVLTKAVAADTGKKGIATQAAALLVAATLLSRGKPKKAV